MKVKFSYLSSKGKMWSTPLCKVVDEEKYDENCATYLPLSVAELYYISWIDDELSEIERVKKGEKECHKSGTDIFFVDVYKDRVEFKDVFQEWPDWSCTLEEYKRVLLGQRTFLMLPKEPESYLEIKVNDL